MICLKVGKEVVQKKGKEGERGGVVRKGEERKGGRRREREGGEREREKGGRREGWREERIRDNTNLHVFRVSC